MVLCYVPSIYLSKFGAKPATGSQDILPLFKCGGGGGGGGGWERGGDMISTA